MNSSSRRLILLNVTICWLLETKFVLIFYIQNDPSYDNFFNTLIDGTVLFSIDALEKSLFLLIFLKNCLEILENLQYESS